MTFTLGLTLFAAITLTALFIEVMYTYATQGFGFGFSSNRPAVDKSPLGLRIERTYRNQVESAAYVVPLFAAGAVSGLQGPYIALATLLVVVGRALFVLLYYTGIPFARVPGFSLAAMGSMYLAYMLVASS